MLLLFLLLLICSSAAASEDTFFDVLQANGLPIGLVPRAILAFHVDPQGRFDLVLEGPCSAKFENEVHYDANVSGSISYGQIGDLRGVSAQELFLWLPVKGIRVDVPSSGVIYFDVGAVRKQFQLSLFDTPPECQADQEDAKVELQHFGGTDVAERAAM